MTKYVCCQGYLNICCFQAGIVGEESCPDLCLCLEACLCNGFAVSASRMYVMDKYQLSSDPCDYRLIRINNCIQLFACICNLAALFNRDLRHLSRILDHIADVVFHTVSGCMTAQVFTSLRTLIIYYPNQILLGDSRTQLPRASGRGLCLCRSPGGTFCAC